MLQYWLHNKTFILEHVKMKLYLPTYLHAYVHRIGDHRVNFEKKDCGHHLVVHKGTFMPPTSQRAKTR